MKNKYIYLAVLAAAGLTACQPEFENEVSNGDYNAGQANFSSYVAIGNSLTSGVMDGTMSRVGQTYSFPNILAQQFAIVGGGEFTQPSFADDVNNLGGLTLGGNIVAGTRLIIDAGSGGPENISGVPTINVASLQATAYNNMGVPSAKSFHLLAPGYGNLAGVATGQANPYFVRHATSPNTTVLADAMSKNPTFFTNWIGSNDVLAYATSGGTGVNQEGNPNFASYGGNDITDPAAFAGVYSTIVNTLTSAGAKGVVATIPNVTSIPFFTTVPYNPINSALLGGGNETTGRAVIAQLNTQLYGPLSQALAFFGQGARIQPLTPNDVNPLLINDESLANLAPQLTAALTAAGYPAPQAAAIGQIFGQARQATNADLILLTTRTVIGTAPANAVAPFDKFGITFPLQDQHVLTASEVYTTKIATEKFNASIRSIAASKGLAIADMNAILNQLQSRGLQTEDGQIYNAEYFSTARLNTSLFSLDGVHPNARGYAIIANEILKVINTHYGAKLPLVVASGYPGATILPSN